MKSILKKIAAKLPTSFQQGLKRHYYGYQIKAGKFVSPEYEFGDLQKWIKEGDWVIDIGANIGQYTKKMAELVGISGRVLAFEPIPRTFELLTANIAKIPFANISLFNVAASDSSSVQGMSIPKEASGLYILTRASIGTNHPDYNILCLTIDSLSIPNPVSLVKIDAEGHDFEVLKGMESLLGNDRPVLIIEDKSVQIEDYLKGFGYSSQRIKDSHNRVFSCLDAY